MEMYEIEKALIRREPFGQYGDAKTINMYSAGNIDLFGLQVPRSAGAVAKYHNGRMQIRTKIK